MSPENTTYSEGTFVNAGTCGDMRGHVMSYEKTGFSEGTLTQATACQIP